MITYIRQDKLLDLLDNCISYNAVETYLEMLDKLRMNERIEYLWNLFVQSKFKND